MVKICKKSLTDGRLEYNYYFPQGKGGCLRINFTNLSIGVQGIIPWRGLGRRPKASIKKATKFSQACSHYEDFCSPPRKKVFLWKERIQAYVTGIKKLSDAGGGQKDRSVNRP